MRSIYAGLMHPSLETLSELRLVSLLYRLNGEIRDLDTAASP